MCGDTKFCSECFKKSSNGGKCNFCVSDIEIKDIKTKREILLQLKRDEKRLKIQELEEKIISHNYYTSHKYSYDAMVV